MQTQVSREMSNKAMQRKLKKRECIDLSGCKRTEDGSYILEKFVDGKDYCDAVTEDWIWSIGKHNVTGQILASTGTRFYQNPEYTCLWLR